MTDAFAIDRRGLLQWAGLGTAAATAPTSAAAKVPSEMLVINALGELTDPNASRRPGAIQGTVGRTLDRRVIDDAKASGMNAVNVTLGYVAGNVDPFEHTIREIGLWDARLRNHASNLVKVLVAADIERARREGKIGIIYGFQNAEMMGKDASRCDVFADLGVRVVQLTYNSANQIGGGSTAPQDRGVTPFGHEVIAALNRNRIMVDLSHSGQRTCLDAARASTQPVSINHTGCRALTDLPRNKTDEELRLVADRGGFLGIYFMPFLSPDSVAEPEDVVAHIDHAVNVCGEDHVGIGTDGGTTRVDDMSAYRSSMRALIAQRRAAGVGAAGENPDTLPFVERLSGPTQFRQLVRLLRARGYSARRVEKIMGLNFLNYAGRVWGA